MKKIVTNQIIKTVTVMYIPLTKYRYIPEEISHQTLVEVIILSQGWCSGTRPLTHSPRDEGDL